MAIEIRENEQQTLKVIAEVSLSDLPCDLPCVAPPADQPTSEAYRA